MRLAPFCSQVRSLATAADWVGSVTVPLLMTRSRYGSTSLPRRSVVAASSTILSAPARSWVPLPFSAALTGLSSRSLRCTAPKLKLPSDAPKSLACLLFQLTK